MKILAKPAVEVMAARIRDIDETVKVTPRQMLFLPENADEFDFSEYSYVVDAVDTVTAKLEIIVRAKEAKVPVISSMGAGNKLDPTRFQVTDIYKTSVCPLARVLRIKLKERGVKRLKVVYSKEAPLTPKEKLTAQNTRRDIPSSISFVPSVAGFIIAGEVIKDIIK